MAIFNVRKNGSGTHTDIQSAIYDSADGDTIDIGAGTFDGNIELYKSVILKGAGKDQTFITGKLASDTFTGCSYYAGEDTLTVASTAGLIKGRRVLGLTANSRVSEIVNGTQFKVSLATPATGNITKTGVTWSSGSSTITLPSVTAVVVGMKVEGSGVSALVTAYNATTKVVTLSSPTTQAGAAASLLFKSAKSGVTVTMPYQFSGSTFPATIQVMNVATNGFQIKDLTVTGFDGNTNLEAAAICMTTPVSAGVHQNWLIDNCKIVAAGDCAFVTSPNIPSNGGTIQNCNFEGKTFTGSVPAEIPAFSSFTRSGVVLTTTTLEMPSVDGIYGNPAAPVGSPISGTGIPASTYITAVNGMVITLSKAMTASVSTSISCTFSNVQFVFPNVARQMVVIGNSSSVSACINTTFKNNTISGQTGAIVGSNKSMFNTAVTIDTVGGLVENNLIDGTFGAGDPNPLASNFAIRSRGAGVVVQNNINKTSGGRSNSGFYVPNGTSTNNSTIDRLLVEVSQSASSSFVESMMEKDVLKSISKVSSDAVFSNEENWKLVNFVFKHSSSSRRLVSSFRSTFDSSKKTKLKTNMKIGDTFELHKIIISKSDRSHLVVKRSEISGASGFDFSLLSDGPSAPTWSKGIPANLGTYGTNGLTVLNNHAGWDNGAQLTTPLTGDFSYTMTHEILVTGMFQGDIMFGYGHAVRDMSLGLTGLGSNRIIYMDQGFGFSNYGTGWVDTPNAVTFVNTPYAVTISRSGSTISWSIVGGVLNISGVAENGYTGDVYPIVAMYNKSRVNSFVIN